MKTKRKALAILLTLCMVLTMLPATALASAGEGLLGETLPEPAVCTMTADCGAAEHDEGCLSQAGPEGIAPLDGAAATPEAITTTPEAVTTTPEAVETTPEHVTVTPEGMNVPENDMIDGQTAETLNAVSDQVNDFVTFYIDKGNIVLGEGTASGYDMEGNLITSVSAVGYRIMQSAGTTADHTITVNDGQQNIVLKDVNLEFNTTATAINISSLQIFGGEATVTLEGQNTMVNNTAYMPGILVKENAKLIITAADTEQSLTARGNGTEASGIGTIPYYPGVTKEFGIHAGTIEIQNGTVTASGSRRGVGIGSAYGRDVQAIKISGGVVTAQGGERNAQWNSGVGLGAGQNAIVSGGIEITGGTVYARGGYYAIGTYECTPSTNVLIDVPITIDGGSIELTGAVGSAQDLKNSGGSVVSRTPVLVQSEEGSALANTEVTLHDVTNNKTWTARTDGNGYLYPYLPEGETIFTLDGSEVETAITGGVSNAIGAICTCQQGDNIYLDTESPITVYKSTEGTDSVSVSLSGRIEPTADCKLQIHKIRYEASVKTQGAPAPKIEGSVLTVYEWEQSYEITVKVINGQNAECYVEKTIAVATDKVAGLFSIADGSITAKLTTEPAIEEGGEPTRNITYSQGDRSVTIPESERFVIEGASSANTIVIESGNPNIVLDQVAISSGNSPSIWIKSGCPVLWLKGENSLNSTRKTYATLQVDGGAGVIIDSEKDEAGMINGKIPSTEPVSGEAHALPQTKYAGSLTVDTTSILGSGNYAPGIGSCKGQVKSQGMQIEIRGGSVTAYASNGTYGEIGTAIGVGGAPTTSNATCAVTITGGNVYTEARSKGFGIGSRNVTIDLTGGTIYSVVTVGNTGVDRAAAIGGTNNDITIGTVGDTENSRELNVVGIGKQTASGIGGVNPKIAIHSGNVYAYGDGNGAAIGGNYGQPIRGIEITGGEIWTKGVTTSIGVKGTSGGQPTTGKAPVEISGGNVHAEGSLGSDIVASSAVVTVTIGSGAALDLTGSVGAPLVNNSSETIIQGNILNDITVNAPTQVTGSLSGSVTVTSGGALDVDGSIKEGESNHVTVESGGSLSVSGSVQTDVTNTGETNIGGNVDGNVTSESGSTVIGGNVTGDLNATGGNIAVGGDVGGNKNTEGAVEESIAVIRFDVNDTTGTVAASVIRRAGDNRPLAEEEIPTPERENYRFEGWNTRIDGMGTPVTAGMEIRGNVTAYAQWAVMDEYKLSVAQSRLTDGTIVIGNGADKTEAVREYAKSLMGSSMFIAEGGDISVTEAEAGVYAVTLTLNGQSVVKNLNITFTETEKTTEQFLVEALEALDSIAAEITGAYSDMELDLMTKAVDEVLRGTDFYKITGRTIEVVGASGAFTVTLGLKDQTGTKEMQTVITLATPETDGEKAAYAIKGVVDIKLTFDKGTSDADVVAAAKASLKNMVTPYEGADTEITVVLLSGIDRYRVTASVGGETVSKVVLVTPVYEGYEPGEPLEGRITGNTDVVLSNDTERNGTTLTVELTGTPAGTVSYQWQKRSESGWINVNDGRSGTLTLSLLTMADDGAQYQCVVTHKVPDTQPAVATLTAAALTVKKGDWPAPDLTVTRPENESGTGSIAGLTTEMELRQGEGEQAGDWTMVSESQAANGITEIPYGTVYQARYAETDYVNAGPVKTIRMAAGVTVSGQVSSSGGENDPVIVTLKQEAAVIASTAAIEGAFGFEGVESGSYTLEISKTGHVTKAFDLTVTDAEISDLVYAIYLIGDVNEDGNVDGSDMQRLYSHVNKSNLLSELAAGDINEDGSVDGSDMQRLYSHLNKSNPLF
ncbi:dockerin type I domain-containing protein [Bacilliculturomica massiliensis]|uniref:dockerin type I domain-containing protein n=1 Tax=Bacilliculturomica massiliensis TaxID=1917867 RepID=UPI0010319993|nr:dockerin type I domain-containing protein [Bacilliculturomica massiliensis]